MGTQSPGTIQRTRFMLMNALIGLLEKKRFQKITVNDICDAAMVSRSAFYVHFSDKYELLTFCMEEIFRRRRRENAGVSLERQMLTLLEEIQASQKMMHNLFQDSLSRELLEIFGKIINAPILERLEELQRAGAELPGSTEFLAAFYSGGMANVILRWIREDFRTPCEEVARCQYEILKPIAGTEAYQPRGGVENV